MDGINESRNSLFLGNFSFQSPENAESAYSELCVWVPIMKLGAGGSFHWKLGLVYRD